MDELTRQFHFDGSLSQLGDRLTMVEKVRFVHEMLQQRHDSLSRIAVALYETQTDTLRTYIYSGARADLRFYNIKLSESESLQKAAELRQPRVINDMSQFSQPVRKHHEALNELEIASSYTLPMFHKDKLCGFIFFNSTEKDFFTTETLPYLDLAGNFIAMTIVHELYGFRTLQAAVQTCRDITSHRDAETGGHLERMANYSRLIAQGVAEDYDLSDEQIERIYMFAPLHDIGKIAIPDDILLKQGKFTDREYELMRKHVQFGAQIIDKMLEHFSMQYADNVTMLCNIVRYHHEMLDGSGYMEGLSGDEIPLEARIIAVADIFDALTSKRPYKDAWSINRALDYMQGIAGTKLDEACVNALSKNREKLESIQDSFDEDILG